nr:hypothetical protein [Tanacetum cinerariifolium]
MASVVSEVAVVDWWQPVAALYSAIDGCIILPGGIGVVAGTIRKAMDLLTGRKEEVKKLFETRKGTKVNMAPVVSEVAVGDWWQPVAALYSAIDGCIVLPGGIGKELAATLNGDQLSTTSELAHSIASKQSLAASPTHFCVALFYFSWPGVVGHLKGAVAGTIRKAMDLLTGRKEEVKKLSVTRKGTKFSRM